MNRKIKYLVLAIAFSILTISYYVWMITAWINLDKSKVNRANNQQSVSRAYRTVDGFTEKEIGGEEPPDYAFWMKEPQYRCNSVLKINTSKGASYVVKVVDPYDDEVILMCYLPAGISKEINVPSGTFEIRYTSGTRWFGSKEMFGPRSSYAKADRTFHFSEGAGYELTLYRVRNGNLHTSSIRKEDF